MFPIIQRLIVSPKRLLIDNLRIDTQTIDLKKHNELKIMKTKKILSTLLTWLPSVIILVFFIPNALHKVLRPSQLKKIITNNTALIMIGIFLLIASAMFLYKKTMLIGTTFLASYMTLIVCIHMYKGKPYEVAILIVMATIFAAYIRKPQLFHEK